MQRLVRWLWAGLMLVLPISSFPAISRFFGVQSVAALSILFLLLLFILWFVPYLWRGGKIPLAAVPILAFVLVGLVASLGSFFLPFPSFRDVSRWKSIVENLVTLGVGISVYLIAASWPREKTDFNHLFRWLNYGGLIMILYSGLQAFYTIKYGGYTAWMENLQTMISSSGLLYFKRVTGLAFEPSWLAHQLNMVYLPWWLAATLRKNSAHKFRVLGFSFENFLLAGGLATLFFSYSRVGWLAFLVVAGYLILDLSLQIIKKLQKVITRRWELPILKTVGKTILPVVMFIGLLAVYLGMFLGAGFGLSRLDPRMEQLFNVTALKEEGVMMFANRLVFAERVVFWETGYEIFNDYPVLGVGIGNAGYYFPEKMPAFGYGLTEVSQLLFQDSGLPNTKSLWTRLAAETGLIGLACFLSWMFILWKSARSLRNSPDRSLQTIGLFGEFVLVGMLVEGFSLDTFALPYFWLSLGILTAGFTHWMQGTDPPRAAM
ncbi:MAG: O-antigen ligase family protein [Bellilinea sp.]